MGLSVNVVLFLTVVSLDMVLPLSLGLSESGHLSGGVGVSPVWRAMLRALPETLSDTVPGTVQCPECGARKAQVEARLSEKQLSELRVELVKQQILQKLRLKEAPHTSLSPSALPRPLASQTILHPATQLLNPSKDIDDFYGKTDQVILFPREDVSACGGSAGGACLTFAVPREVADDAEVSAAQLWLHTADPWPNSGPGPGLLTNCSLVLTEEATTTNNNNATTLLAVVEAPVKEGWLQVPLLEHVARWLRSPHLGLVALHVACAAPAVGYHMPISLRPDLKPFLTISTRAPARPRRTKRSVNCVPGVKECCRENLHISFQDIGWGDWILHPKGYDAYFCRGSCSNAASVTQSGSFYSSIIQRYLSQNGGAATARRVELAPCCTPTKLSSLQLLYVDSNMVVMQKTLPNMVVDACGCM